MDTVPQKELRNQVGEVLRRVERGESLVVTVSGRPVAQLSPILGRRWVSGAALDLVWHGPTPQGLADDLDELGGDLVDPFAR